MMLTNYQCLYDVYDYTIPSTIRCIYLMLMLPVVDGLSVKLQALRNVGAGGA